MPTIKKSRNDERRGSRRRVHDFCCWIGTCRYVDMDLVIFVTEMVFKAWVFVAASACVYYETKRQAREILFFNSNQRLQGTPSSSL